MVIRQMHGILHHLQGIMLRREHGDMAEGQLVERFLTAEDAAAFETLLLRPGPIRQSPLPQSRSQGRNRQVCFCAVPLPQ